MGDIYIYIERREYNDLEKQEYNKDISFSLTAIEDRLNTSDILQRRHVYTARWIKLSDV